MHLRSNEQSEMVFAFEMRLDLSREVDTNVENLVGIGEHERKPGSEFESNRTGFGIELRRK